MTAVRMLPLLIAAPVIAAAPGALLFAEQPKFHLIADGGPISGAAAAGGIYAFRF